MLGQFAVLAGLAATVGLGPAGWLAGTGYALVCWGLLSQVLARPEVRRWGPADTVTLARAILVGAVTALVADSLGGPGPGSVPALVALAAVALLLDGVDGQVARRTGTCSRWGARFDMETDAFLVLVLSAFVAGGLGGWVLAVGIPRYAFGAAGLIWPWLRAPVPERRSRKVVAATQGIALVVASAGVLPVPLAAGALGLLLVLLGWSFGRDIGWLWRARHRVPVARVAVAR
jgi:phosphatidylglycerophosphate synthase